GAVRGQVVHACDWMPTLAELGGVKLLNADIDGKSLVPVIRSATALTPHETLHWLVGGGKRPQWAVRQGQWKLIGNVQDTSGGELSADDKKLFLSDLTADVSEKTNHAKQHPEVVARLLKLHDDWLAAQKTASPEPASSQDKRGNEK
ncbi:MAG: hypothetical protein NTY01_00020, partial [Verrucomicrobia bacterium]|nr:hypothetical protein [Verrucomicrobiota bacterium]